MNAPQGFTDANNGEYWDPRLKSYVITVQPGDFSVTGRSDLAIATLLGSCVSACICDPYAAVGGLNHFLLPENSGGIATGTRYGVHAMEMLINEILKNGGQRHRLEAKLFGGAKILSLSSATPIGEKNQTFALDFMRREEIPVIASDLGGKASRRVFFKPGVNKVLVAIPNRQEEAQVRREEVTLGQKPAIVEDSGDVDLF